MPVFQQSLYEILGVPPTADDAAIKDAYRTLSRKTHPDIAGEAMKPIFLTIQHAYSVLSDPAQRAAYDREQGHATTAPDSGSAGGGSTAADPPPRREESGAGASGPPPGGGRASSTGAESRFTVPPEVYSGPLPAEAIDVSAMPWISDDGFGELAITPVGRPRMFWWAIAGGATLLSLFALVVSPLVMFTVFPSFAVWLWLRFFSYRGWLKPLAVWGAGWLFTGVASVLYQKSQGVLSYGYFGAAVALVLLAQIAGAIALQRILADSAMIRPEDARQFTSWGDPGVGLKDAEDAFGHQNVMDGIEGERLTVGQIGYYLGAIPGVRVVNGLRFPGSLKADVDHAVICGDKIAFIDSKAWVPADYEMSPDWENVIARYPNGRYEHRQTHMHAAVTSYRRRLAATRGLRGVQSRGYITVHPKVAGHPLTLRTDQSSDANRLVTAEQLLVELGEWFTQDREQARTVDRRLLSFALINKR